MVCASVFDGELALAHVGDSRLYLIRQGHVRSLTRDHSLAMAMALQGEIAFEEVRSHRERNKISRSLGDRRPLPDYYVDSLEVSTGEETFQLQPGDTLLLCSDGVWEPVTEEEMAAAASRTSDPAGIAEGLLKKVLERGAPDNATVVLLRTEQDSGAEEETDHGSIRMQTAQVESQG
jgi:protein phosphatase